MALHAKTWVAAALAFGAAAAPAAGIDVMTQNQYVGADLAAVLQAATAPVFDPQAFAAAVVDTLGRIAASRPAERMRALTAKIAQRHPDVVALQEAYGLACMPYPGFPTQPGLGCDDPLVRGAFNDHLQDTAALLTGRYRVVAQVTNLNVPAMPFSVRGYPALLSLADRDAILVRADRAAAPVNLAALTGCRASDHGCNFTYAPPPFPTPLGAIAIERGYLAVDVQVDGRTMRVFNTHLEQRLLDPTLPQTRLLQVGQAYELLGAVMATWDGQRPTLLLGDINSAPGDAIPVPPYPALVPGIGLPTAPPYAVFASVLTDAWTLRPRADDPGLSCCQAEALDNVRSALYERIDMVFSLTRPSRVVDMRLLGQTMGDKTRPPGAGGVWPSDHAAVAARLAFD